MTLDLVGLQLEVGTGIQLRAFATTDNGWTGIDMTEMVEWTVDRESRATVGDGTTYPRGFVVAHERGDVKIQARDPVTGVRSDRDSGVIEIVYPGQGGDGSPVGDGNTGGGNQCIGGQVDGGP